LPWSAVSGHAVLLYGPPGTGKTTYARALARECGAGVALIQSSYSEWQAFKEGHLGNVVGAIRKVFADARAKAPCILFIDEIDSLPARGTSTRHDEWWRAVTNCVLEEFTAENEGVVVIAACNSRPDRLDPALIRSGRLDRHIEIPLPDIPGLVGIFRSHLTDMAGADLLPAALAARGHTGADVERWVREARAKARRSGQRLTVNLLVETVREGAPALPDQVRRLVSYHEAAHAIANIALRLAKPVALSIGSGGAGETNSVIEEVRAHTRLEIEQILVSLLAGRAAEEIACGITTAGAGGGAASDLGHATRIAVRLETVYGLGTSGLAHLPGEPDRLLLMSPDLFGAVQASLYKAYAGAKDLLNANRASLDALANALFERGYLDAAEIEAVLQATPLARPAPAAEEVVMTAPSEAHLPNQPGYELEPERDAESTEVKPAAS
jgi:ATP-dependent Zn protease